MAEHDPRHQRAVDALEGLAAGGAALERPPAGLWDRIAAEAFADDGAEPADAEADPAAEPAHEPTARTPGGASEGLHAAPPVADLGARRGIARSRRTFVLQAAAVVVAVLVGFGAAWVAFGPDGGGDEPSPQTVASTDLDPIGDVGRGTATVVDVDGRTQLELDVQDLPETAGFYEVWIATPDLDGLVSLGPVRADGVYDLPEGFDPGELPVVDISDEPLDGDPGHSTISVLRGTLTA